MHTLIFCIFAAGCCRRRNRRQHHNSDNSGSSSRECISQDAVSKSILHQWGARHVQGDSNCLWRAVSDSFLRTQRNVLLSRSLLWSTLLRYDTDYVRCQMRVRTAVQEVHATSIEICSYTSTTVTAARTVLTATILITGCMCRW